MSNTERHIAPTEVLRKTYGRLTDLLRSCYGLAVDLLIVILVLFSHSALYAAETEDSSKQPLTFAELYLPDTAFYQWQWWPIEPITDKTMLEDLVIWSEHIHYSAGIEAQAGSGKHTPFWMHTNQQGRYATQPFAGYLNASIYKLALNEKRWYDYDWAVECTAAAYNTGAAGPERHSRFPYYNWQNGSVQINNLYAHARLFIFDITAGISPVKSIIPNARLSTGGLMMSGNAMPMPGISVGIDRYTAVPGCYGFLELMGHVEHNWITDNVYVEGAKLHYLMAGGRAGGKLPVNVSFEVEHAAQWGGYSPYYGNLGNDFHSWLNACLGRAGGSMKNDQLNAQGNHLLTQKWQLDIKGSDHCYHSWKVSTYWQTLSEDNSKAFTGRGTNLADGLWGVCMTQNYWPYISAVTLEYVGTSDQTGPFHDQDGLIYAGNDSYYLNSVYQNGWNYFYRTIGNPFITSPIYNEDGTIYTTNNRTKVWHLGLEGKIWEINYRALASYVRNWGTYRDSDVYTMHSQNVALLVEANYSRLIGSCSVDKPETAFHTLDVGVRLGADIGTQFGNQVAGAIYLRVHGPVAQYRKRQ